MFFEVFPTGRKIAGGITKNYASLTARVAALMMRNDEEEGANFILHNGLAQRAMRCVVLLKHASW